MIFSHGGATVAYEVHGQGLPVVFLHGFPGDRRSMLGCMEPVFARRGGFRRVYLDLPGLGGSRAPMVSASADGVLALLLAFLDEVTPGPFLLGGYSYGGYLAQGVADRLASRLRGLLLLCPVVHPRHALRTLPAPKSGRADGAFLRTLTPLERETFCAYMAVANAETYGRYIAELDSGFSPNDPDFIAAWERHYEFSQELPHIVLPCPTLLIAGRQDTCVGYRDQLALLDDYPQGTFALLDLAGHNLQIDRPALFEALVSDWLERIE